MLVIKLISSHRRSSAVNTSTVNPRIIYPAGRSKSTKVTFMMKPRVRDTKVVVAAYGNFVDPGFHSRIDLSNQALKGLSGRAIFTLVAAARRCGQCALRGGLEPGG